MSVSSLREKIENKGGVWCVSMATIRDHCGFERLGVHVVDRMARAVDGVGIGFLPVESTTFPMDRTQKVTLYLKDTRVGRVLEATRQPTRTVSLKEFRAANSDEAADMLEEIRMLVCERARSD
jgi:hypothetical protein